jgi:hypothetical protein
VTIIHGDCIEAMQAMDAESVDSICTDPPYGLEFMGKEWDRLKVDRSRPDPTGKSVSPFYRPGWGNSKTSASTLDSQAWHQRWAEAAYRVAKPSAYLLAFGGTRTVHRMTVALEDAGWIIRDMLVWGYASGFPKSKASLKPAWEPIVMARKPGPLRMLAIDECRIPIDDDGDGNLNRAGKEYRAEAGGLVYGGGRGFTADMPTTTFYHAAGRWPANVILTATEDGRAIFDGGIEGVVGGGTVEATRSVRVRAGSVIGNGNTHGEFVSSRDSVGGYDDSGTYSRFFLLPKADRGDREPALYPFCTCETVKLGAWQRQGRRQPVQTGSTSRARGISEATSEGGNGSLTMWSGSSTSDPSPLDSRSTTSTETSKTTGSPTSKPSIPSPISDSTPAARSSTASGGSGAESASYTDPSPLNGSTSPPKAGPSTDGAGHATSARSSRPSVCAECGKEVMPSRAARINAHPT